jgi:hypothetical protein
MANEEHLARLEQGAEVWNQWREADFDIKPDLTGVDLTGVDLSGVDLSRADLTGADLTGANLTGAHLFRANLTGVNFSGANFTRADLYEAYIDWALFVDVDLSTAQRLETPHHQGPSTIGIDTLYRSNGQIPEVFLRGTGVPEDFIPYIKSLVGHPFEFYSCFIRLC